MLITERISAGQYVEHLFEWEAMNEAGDTLKARGRKLYGPGIDMAIGVIIVWGVALVISCFSAIVALAVVGVSIVSYIPFLIALIIGGKMEARGDACKQAAQKIEAQLKVSGIAPNGAFVWKWEYPTDPRKKAKIEQQEVIFAKGKKTFKAYIGEQQVVTLKKERRERQRKNTIEAPQAGSVALAVLGPDR